jgi:type IV fimbrial biogenesis protein FimT
MNRVIQRCQGHFGRRVSGGGGFTLIELMVVVSVLAILMALAAPSFSGLIASQRGKTVASELFMALSKTRSEAIARNASVTLSPKSGGWQNGWQILDPANAANILEDRGVATGATVMGPDNMIYRASGRLPSAAAPAPFVVTTTANSTSFYQCISVDLNGRPYMKAASSC